MAGKAKPALSMKCTLPSSFSNTTIAKKRERYTVLGPFRVKCFVNPYLCELGLAVGAEVLVAVASGELEVPVHPRRHEKLLVLLRALRQSVEFALKVKEIRIQKIKDFFN